MNEGPIEWKYVYIKYIKRLYTCVAHNKRGSNSYSDNIFGFVQN